MPRRAPLLAASVVACLVLAVALSSCRLPGMVGEASFGDRQHADFPSAVGPVAHLVNVRAWPHDGFDRVVFEFDGDRVPTWLLRFVDEPIRRSGRGDVVAVEGAAHLEVTMTAASAFDRAGPVVQPSYPGPDRVTLPSSGIVTEVVSLGELEQTMRWVVGLDQAAPFAVAEYGSPPRLVIDVVAPAG